MIYLEIITSIAAAITLLYLATIVFGAAVTACVCLVHILLDWTLKQMVRARGRWA